MGAGTLGVAMLATGASAVAQATDSQQDPNIQVKLADRSLRLGQPIEATGTLRGAAAGTPVSLQFRPRSSGDWTTIANAATADGGAFKLTGTPSGSGSVRVAPGAGARTASAGPASTGGTSAVQSVDVHAKVLSSTVRAN